MRDKDGTLFHGFVENLQIIMPAIKALVPQFIAFGRKVRDVAVEFAAKLAPTIKEVAGFVERDLVPAFKAFGAFVMNTVLPAIGGFFKFLSDNRGAVAFFAGAILGVVAAFKIFNVIMGVVRVATLLAAGAQAILNFLLTANPIGLVVLAIVALIAGLAAAYAASEDFRKVVDGVFKVLGQVAGVIMGALGAAFGFLVGVFETVMAVVAPIAHIIGTVLGGAFSLLGGAIEFVGNLFGTFIKMVTDSPLFKIVEGIGSIAGGIVDFVTGGDKKKTTTPASSVGTSMGGMFGRTAPAVTPASTGGYTGGPSGAPVTNVSVTLDGKNIATSVDKRLGGQARAFTPARTGAAR
jgi:phage-related protein